MTENAIDGLKTQIITNIGEMTVGGTSDVNRVIMLALANMNDPFVNEVLLAFQVKFSDRFTKTRVFPRNGMALPNGEVYTEKVVEPVVSTDDLSEVENA